MNKLLAHRGIRETHVELEKGIFLGHVRLPIQGLGECFDHPYTFGPITGAFVGEIFNYNSIDSRAKSDLPVLIHSYFEEGDEAFKRFDGFWAVILYNKIQREFRVMVDFLAKKPLYMRLDTLGISSEIKALIPLGDVSLNKTYISAVHKWGYCPDYTTIFNEIVKIPPGGCVVIDHKGQIKGTYIYDKLEPKLLLISNELTLAVKNRTVSDVPISLLMSGGLDSTIIYYLLREFQENIKIFHIANDEAQYLDYIDFRPGDQVTSLEIPTEITNTTTLQDILYYNDGPVDLGSMIPQFLLAKEIRKHGISVCLSGDGADELFGGYKRAMQYDSQYSDIFHELVFYHLPRLDKMMMSSMVELRSPFLARSVIEAAMALPYFTRMGKNGLKAIFQGIIPKEILDREKKPLRFKENQRVRLIHLYTNTFDIMIKNSSMERNHECK